MISDEQPDEQRSASSRGAYPPACKTGGLEAVPAGGPRFAKTKALWRLRTPVLEEFSAVLTPEPQMTEDRDQRSNAEALKGAVPALEYYRDV